MTDKTTISPSFKPASRISPNVQFDQKLMQTGKPPENLLFGMLAAEGACSVEKPNDTLQTSNQVSEGLPLRKSVANPETAKIEIAPLPTEAGNHWVIWMLALLVILLPATGSLTQELLPDTLKSGIAALMVLGCATMLFWSERARNAPLRWHSIMWLPIVMLVYALASTAWAHTYLASVELVRWFLFALTLWLSLNAMTLSRAHALFLGIHLGAFGAAVWGTLQFWFDLGWFNQGPNPASTFVNRNFAAEYMVMTVPFSLYLIFMSRNTRATLFLIITAALNIVYLMQTGTRSALAALFVILPLLGMCFYIWRKEAAFITWPRNWRVGLMLTFALTVVCLGTIPTGNPKIKAESFGTTAFERAIGRTQSISTSDSSFNVRLNMWKQSIQMIKANPLLGVGAGNWEAESPKWFDQGQFVEIDYYVHNEYLQIIAEYGVVGWIFILGLLLYLLVSAWRTLRTPFVTLAKPDTTSQSSSLWGDETVIESIEKATLTNVNHSVKLLRLTVLASLLALLIISLAGFAWRLASTGILFALCLGLLAAFEPSQKNPQKLQILSMPWNSVAAHLASGIALVCLVVAIFVFQQAILAERYIIRAITISLQVNQDRRLKPEQVSQAKERAWAFAREGVAINPHYRKLTSLIAEETSKWGDWAKAAWILDGVIESRPYVPALLVNAALAQVRLNDMTQAQALVERALKLQPVYPDAQAIQLYVFGETKKYAEALPLAEKYLEQGNFNSGGLAAAYDVAMAMKSYSAAQRAAELLVQQFPQNRVEGLIRLAKVYETGLDNDNKALEFYRQAMRETGHPAKVLGVVSDRLRTKL